ncbi:carbohydrate ABC transporter substrate-binding protein, CUT1 family [Actinokineospora alba]|uniref:Carbohydrate ABC transporter substrate-binding protein, CUT1 family n=1 Tax=Actinokineospora alba TaxID=504798 RepID=A0A1H0FYI4_9PSEU|nr:extracellular solute-binding protein [Actinokineospora alba]TDP69684.1 carbohydrate ABC transporter substrate-binding protein (CUT1 family) [Actinokineospora alba]SDI11263.1 multiple sugar transport system substrate-binding protein [Actinokineospora alba]SDN99738.1 carbohydrate ABC transporter substrate-binding protein, CUT1 family [Actinokineospora alba]
MRARLGGIAALSAAVVMLAGCGIGGDDGAAATGDTGGEVKGEVSLQTWALKPKFTGYVEGVIDAFEKKYPGTTVKWLDQPGDGYSAKVLTQAAAGDLPDVVNLPPDFALPLVKQNLLLDVAKADDKLKSDYVAGGVSAYEFAGHQGAYGYPWYLNTDVHYWNSELLAGNGLDPKRLPSTLDELIAQARVMKEKSGGQMYLMSRKPGLGDLVNAGVKLLSDDGTRFTFNTPEAAAVLDKYRAAFAEGLLPRDVLTDKYLGNSELFKKQQVAWTTGGGNSINDYKRDNPTLAPKIVASPAFGTPPLYVQGLSVSRTSKNLPAALALARFVTSPENQAAFAELVPGIFPSTTASAADPRFSQSDGTNAGDAKVIAFQALAKAKLLQPPLVTEAMGDYIKQQFSLAISGEIPAKEALDRSVKKCDELLKS